MQAVIPLWGDLVSCSHCGDLVPASHGGHYESGDYCRPCLVAIIREDLVLLATELAS